MNPYKIKQQTWPLLHTSKEPFPSLYSL